jgi:glutathione synthase
VIRIGFVVNDIQTEMAGYSTTRLALSALARGHEAWVMGAADFVFDTDDRVHANARMAPKRNYKAGKAYLADLLGDNGRYAKICVDELDVLLLRSDPSVETGSRAWAQSAGIVFGRAAMRSGVIVLNDPNGLAKAANKMYFQLFPEEVRPRTLITRSREDIRCFVKDHGDRAVIKPLQGSGGQNVFLIDQHNKANLNQMVDAVARDGFIIVQEYLEQAVEGDMRLFLMNGQPFRYKGKYAAFRRVRTGDDMRSNIHAGGAKAEALVDDAALHLAEIVRPKLVEDGMFLVGLDIVGDKLMEINVFSPGGLGSAQQFANVNFSNGVIEALERKVQYMKYYRRNFNNVDMATL